MKINFLKNNSREAIKMNSKHILIFLALIYTTSVFGQQTPQTSFFNEGRAFWNPAYVGNDQQLTFNTYLRQQWLGFGLDAPRLIAVDFQYPFVDYNMAASGALVYDQTGPVSKRGVQGNYSYQLREIAGGDGMLSLGITAGGFQYVFNPSNTVVNSDGDPLIEGGTKSGFFPSVGGGVFYQSNTEKFRNNTNFYFGGSFLQAYETNVLVGDINQQRVSHMILDIGSKIYGYDYMVQPSLSVNLTTPEIINLLAGVTFEMKDKFWAGVGYSSVRDFAFQGGYIFDEIAGRDTRLRVGVLGTVGLGDRLEQLGPGAELFIRYELDMD